MKTTPLKPPALLSLPVFLANLMRRATNIPSALGIRRIRDVDVSQVLHASEADIRTLRARLLSWGVPSFRNYPVLLRALTHPSISNWAERVLSLPRRSLGPNTLELLGDRVVGTAVAYRTLQWRKRNELNVPWHGSRPTILVNSLVGNRGMAIVASDIGIDQLIRWEKGIPPESHRERLTSAGVDEVTGLLSNVQINALSSAYEAVSAAIYLDGGFCSAENFVHKTLLQSARNVQRANVDGKEYEEVLARELESVLGASISFVASRHRPGRSASIPIRSFERVQCEVLDLESTTPQNEAHRIYYCGIALRPMSEVDNSIREEDLLYIASHFSVENARIAAFMGAIETVRGQRRAHITSKNVVVNSETLRMRQIIFGAGSPEIKVTFRRDGAWWLDGDYSHVARVLHRVGVPGMASLQDFHVADVRERFQSAYRQRNVSILEEDSVGTKKKQLLYTRKDPREGGFPRVERGMGEAAVCVDSIAECLEVGTKIESSRRLTQEHEGLRMRFGTAEDVSNGITETLDNMRDEGMEDRSVLMKSYHALGHHAMKLWCVQRSMADVWQDRGEVIGECERRGSVGPKVQEVMMGDALGEIGDLSVKKVFVALGICVEKIGLETAVRWLSGAEQRLLDQER